LSAATTRGSGQDQSSSNRYWSNGNSQHVPGDVVGEQAAQDPGVVTAGVEGCLCLVEDLDQPRVRVHLAAPPAGHIR